MKNFIFMPWILFLLLASIGCQKGQDNNSGDGKISLIKTIPGGCNNQDMNSFKSAGVEHEDTVIITVVKDTLHIFAGINYICCAPFKTKSTVSNDSIIIHLDDACPYPYQSCYCRCMCYYTWDFLFTDFEEKNYGYKIILNDPRQKDPVTIQEGHVEL